MATTRFSLDRTHSQVGFAVKHMVISTVRGQFREFSAEAEVDGDDVTTAKLSATVQATSVDTGTADRDTHLRSADFFDTERYPTITFASSKIEHRGGTRYAITGDLTLHGVTRQIELDGEVEGPATDPWGNTRFGVSARGAINRTDFGLTYSAALETGGLIVSEDVRLELEAELVAAKEPATA